MIEVGLALTVLVIALAAMSASNMRMHGLRRSNRDRTVAQNAVQTIAENVQSISRAGVGDPSGWGPHVIAALSAGGELGTTFDVPELTPRAGETHVGSIQVVRDETATDAVIGVDLGLPRDLNGDGDAGDLGVGSAARILPVIVRVRWHSQAGDQEITHPFYIVGF
jgi:hypothetical protein